MKPACVFAALLGCARVASAQPAFPAHDVQIVVTVHDAATANVAEEYALSARPNDPAFAFLASPCTSVGPIAATLNGRRVSLDADASAHAPWTTLRMAQPSSNGAGDTLAVRYDVRTTGSDATIPIVLPSAVLQRSDGARGASVRVDVRLDDAAADARVLLPKFERAASARAWQARFLAIPAFVRIHVSDGAACDRPLSGSAGGLEWRTAVFTGTMALWVPIYLWWFGRWRRAS